MVDSCSSRRAAFGQKQTLMDERFRPIAAIRNSPYRPSSTCYDWVDILD